ncbi:MAG TPA: hypothetical protein VKS79_08730 [Gemmataceae bacterium]|nr:hypothetical protein [Gemmataceae bacterium]
MRWFVVFGSLAISVHSVGFASDPPRTIKPVVVWTGIDSKQPKDSFARCCSAKEWQAIWDAHCGQQTPSDGPSCLDVNFDSYMVIAVFRRTSRIRVGEIIEEMDCVRLRYHPWGDQLVFVPPSDGSNNVKIWEAGRGELDPDKPYLLSFVFVVLPRANKAFIIEEDVQDWIGKSPVWKEKAKFPALTQK